MDKKLKFITKELIEEAALEINKKGIPKKREGKEYSVIIHGKEYPFKLLITEAAKLADIELNSGDFSSTESNRKGFEKLTGYKSLPINDKNIGLLASDNTGWQNNYIKKRIGNKYSIIWNSKRPTGIDKTIEKLRKTIERNGYFDFCYVVSGYVKYIVQIERIAETDRDLKTWKDKDEILFFHNKMTGYSDKNKSAKIVFLCSSFREVTPLIPKEKFKLYGNSYPVQDNLSPFYMESISSMLSNDEQDANAKTMKSNLLLNQILYGPPGTGKTFHTINKAIEIIGEDHVGNKLRKEDILKMDRNQLKAIFDKFVDKGQIVFTTFHQSMSYEDFVEGIKPQEPKEEGKPLVYKVEDGIFKKICEEAKKTKRLIIKIENSETDLTPEIFEDNYKSFVDKLPDQNENDSVFILETPLKFKFWLFKNSAGSIAVKAGEKTFPMSLSLNELTKVLFENKPPNLPSYTDAVINKILENLDFRRIDNDNTNKPFILIIDEINRGNVSAIFGELITLIEKDKRIGGDEELKVVLPYSKNIKQKFGVPSNLYIIGTMNTADRSVEALDTALRRRFSFEEMPPKPDIIKKHGKLKDKEEMKVGILEVEGYDINLGELLRTINKRLEILLDNDHLIGHSYFMDVDSTDSLKEAFSKQIIPLLQEYFYGDYGKLSLVLGEGFCKGEKVKNVSEVFAYAKDYEIDAFAEKVVYELKDPREMDNEAINEAIKILLKDQKEAPEDSEQDTK